MIFFTYLTTRTSSAREEKTAKRNMDHSYTRVAVASQQPLTTLPRRRNSNVQAPPSSSSKNSFYGMITPPVMSHLRELELRHFDSPLYRDTTQVFFSDIQFHSILGKGKYSSVYKVQLPSSGELRTNDEQYYALKLLDPARIKQEVSRGYTTTSKLVASAAEEIYREATILAAHHHPNIISLRGVAAEGLVGSFSSTFENYGYFLVLELIHETLQERIPRWQQFQRPRLWPPSRRLSAKSSSSSASSLLGETPSEESRGDLPERIAVATAIATAVAYLHHHQIVVRDLCPESIGFDASGQVKLFDLGLARSPQECLLDIQLDGNFRYMAPEIMICQSSGFPGDIYSFGVLFWELMTLQQPYEAYFTMDSAMGKPIFCQSKFTNEVILNKQFRPNCSTIADPEIRRLIQECWCADPEARPNSAQVVWRLEQSIAPGQRRRRSSYSQRRRSSVQRRHSSVQILPNLSRVVAGETRPSEPRGRVSDMELAAAAVAADPTLFFDADDSDNASLRDLVNPSSADVCHSDADGPGGFSFSDLIDSCLIEEPSSSSNSHERYPQRSLSLTNFRSKMMVSKSERPTSLISLNKIFDKKKDTNLMGGSHSSLPGAYCSSLLPDIEYMVDPKKKQADCEFKSRTVPDFERTPIRRNGEKAKGKKKFSFFSKRSFSRKKDQPSATTAVFGGRQYSPDVSVEEQ